MSEKRGRLPVGACLAAAFARWHPSSLVDGLILVSFCLTAGETPKAGRRRVVHLPAREGRQELAAPKPEECPPEAEEGDNFAGVDILPFRFMRRRAHLTRF
ncbi:MAG: hypothetical protein LBH85_00645 [Treponema sp.]|jgi:hypothetical protein|nr:hypothetical protein [Treponema sp.]